MIFCLAVIGVVLFQKYVLFTAIPGWTSSLILITLSIIMQLFTVTLMVLLMQLSARKNMASPNIKIYKKYVESVKKNL